jgi:hypothetical protein
VAVLKKPGFLIVSIAVGLIHVTANGQLTYANISSADSFLATGSASNPSGTDLTGLNFGGAGALAVAPPSSPKGEFKTILRFNLSGATNLFTQTFGPNWIVGSVVLQLTSNNGVAGEQPNNPIFNVIASGSFFIQWLSDDSWVEGTGNVRTPTQDGVTYDFLPTLLSNPSEILCTNTYVPPGDNVPVAWPLPLTPGFLADVTAGSDVSFLLSAADNQVSYLFNSSDFGHGNEPQIHITAIPLLQITAFQMTNNILHIAAIGAKNFQYSVQAITNLVATNWQTLGTATADASGNMQFDDFSATNLTQRFYRLAD